MAGGEYGSFDEAYASWLDWAMAALGLDGRLAVHDHVAGVCKYCPDTMGSFDLARYAKVPYLTDDYHGSLLT